MSFCIGFGKLNRYFYLIFASALFKILINLSYKIEYQEKMSIESISILNRPILNDHICIRFIYYYFGLICFGIIFQKIRIKRQKNEINNNTLTLENSFNSNDSNNKSINQSRLGSNNLIHHNYLLEKSQQSYQSLILAAILFILNEMIVFYFDQKHYCGVNFWVLEIFFIHFLFLKKKKLQLYKHQILSFSIIIIFSFGIKLASSFTKQCEYPLQDPNDIDEKFKEMTRNASDIAMRIFNTTFFNNSLRQSIIDTNNKGTRACKNMYNVLILDYKFEYLILLAAFGYLLGLFLHSYSAVKFKFYIDEKYISPYLIIIFIGIIGFALSLILLLISSLKSCGSNSNYINNFCHLQEYNFSSNFNPLNPEDTKTKYYFDNFLVYISRMKEAFNPHDGQNGTFKYGEKVRKTKDGIMEIIFNFILPVLGFFKTTYDLLIIKELGIFHILYAEVIYQLIKDLIVILYKIFSGISDNTQFIQFIFIGISNVFAIVGFSIYLELIEVRFCDFDKNIKKNIVYRSFLEAKGIDEDDIDNNLRLSDLENEREDDTPEGD